MPSSRRRFDACWGRPGSSPFACRRVAEPERSECLDRMIFFGEDSLRRAVREYLAHYHAERNHQGLGNAIVAPLPAPPRPSGACAVVSDSAACSATTIEKRRSVSAVRLSLVTRRRAGCADGYVQILTSVVWQTIECESRVAEPRSRCAPRRLERRLRFWTIRLLQPARTIRKKSDHHI